MAQSAFTFILSIGLLLGCEAKQITYCEDPTSSDCPTSPTFGGGATSSAVKVTSIKPLVAKPGQEVTVTGTNLTNDAELRIGDQVVSWASADGTTAKFLMPVTSRAGAFAITVRRKDQSDGSVDAGAKFLLSESADDALPIFMARPEEICAPQAFRDADGVLQMGLKDCINGALPQCASDGQTNCVANASYAAHSSCSSNGQQSCAVNGSFFAGTACGVDGFNCFLPTYAETTQPLKAISYDAINSSAASIRSGTTLGAVAGTLADCSSDGLTGCVTTSSYQSANLTNLTPYNIKSGVPIAGVTGQYPSTTYPLTGATTTADLDAATFDAKVKSATAFEYWDSAGVRQTGAGDADIDGSKIKAGEYIFGTLGTFAGIAPNPWDVRAGTVINGVPGKLKVNCRNGIVSARYNYDGPIGSIPATAISTGTSLDPWDTIDDSNGGTVGSFVTLYPNANLSRPWTPDNLCGGVEATAGDDNVWKDVTTTGNGVTPSTCADTPLHCTFQDKISGLQWSKNQSPTNQQTWMSGLNICEGLTFNGSSDWRLPTQKELMDAYNHGIRSASRTNWFTDSEMSNSVLSATSYSGASDYYIYVNLRNGYVGNYGGITKSTGLNMVFCVR